MFFHKVGGVTSRFGVQHIGYVALLPKLDRLRSVRGDVGVAHATKQIAQNLRIGMSELDEFEAIGSGWIFGRDLRFWRVVRKRNRRSV